MFRYGSRLDVVLASVTLFSATVSFLFAERILIALDDMMYWSITILLLLLLSQSQFRYELAESIKQYRLLIRGIVIAMTFMVGILIISPNAYRVVWGEGEYLVGFCDSPHTLASTLCLLAVFAFSSCSRLKVLSFVVLFVGFYAVMQTGARIFLVGYLIIFFLHIQQIRLSTTTKKLVVIISCGLLVLIALRSNVIDKFDYLSNFDNPQYLKNTLDAFTSGRTIFWEIDLQAFFAGQPIQLIIGNGFDFVYALNKAEYGMSIWAHNDVITVLLGAGFLGLAVYCVVLIRCFSSIKEGLPSCMDFAFCFAYFIVPFFFNGLFLYAHYIFSFVILCSVLTSSEERSINPLEFGQMKKSAN